MRSNSSNSRQQMQPAPARKHNYAITTRSRRISPHPIAIQIQLGSAFAVADGDCRALADVPERECTRVPHNRCAHLMHIARQPWHMSAYTQRSPRTTRTRSQHSQHTSVAVRIARRCVTLSHCSPAQSSTQTSSRSRRRRRRRESVDVDRVTNVLRYQHGADRLCGVTVRATAVVTTPITRANATHVIPDDDVVALVVADGVVVGNVDALVSVVTGALYIAFRVYHSRSHERTCATYRR
jgi:hypothetical protein